MFTCLRPPPPKKREKFPTLWGDHPEKHDCCFRTHNPASPTCLWRCWAVAWWTGVDISGRICQTDPDKLRHTAATHICIHSVVICPSIEFTKFPIIHPPAWVPHQHALAGSEDGHGGLTDFSILLKNATKPLTSFWLKSRERDVLSWYKRRCAACWRCWSTELRPAKTDGFAWLLNVNTCSKVHILNSSSTHSRP